MKEFILHIANTETFHAGQIFAVRDADEAIEVIRRKVFLDIDQLDQKFFKENGWCSLTSMYCDHGAGDYEVQMMTVEEYQAKLKAEHEARLLEVTCLLEE